MSRRNSSTSDDTPPDTRPPRPWTLSWLQHHGRPTHRPISADDLPSGFTTNRQRSFSTTSTLVGTDSELDNQPHENDGSEPTEYSLASSNDADSERSEQEDSEQEDSEQEDSEQEDSEPEDSEQEDIELETLSDHDRDYDSEPLSSDATDSSSAVHPRSRRSAAPSPGSRREEGEWADRTEGALETARLTSLPFEALIVTRPGSQGSRDEYGLSYLPAALETRARRPAVPGQDASSHSRVYPTPFYDRDTLVGTNAAALEQPTTISESHPPSPPKPPPTLNSTTNAPMLLKRPRQPHPNPSHTAYASRSRNLSNTGRSWIALGMERGTLSGGEGGGGRRMGWGGMVGGGGGVVGGVDRRKC